MSSSKEMATKAPNALSTEVQGWGSDVTVGNDLLISKLLIMQGTSVLVSDGRATVGDFRDSITGDKLGSVLEPVEVIPLHVQKMWDILQEDDDGQFQWERSEPIIENPMAAGYNDNLPWDDKENGVKIKRVRRLNFFVLLPSHVESGTAIPYVLSFKSTSLKEGQKMLNQMYVKNIMAKLTPASYTFKIGGVKKENDKGKWYLPTVALGRQSTKEEVAAALEWYKRVSSKSSNIKVDESDVTKGDKASQMDLPGDY